MFLHLGKKTSILKKDIIGIFDYDLVKKNNITKEFIEIFTDEHKIDKKALNNEFKSFVLIKDKVYLTSVSTTALKNRVVRVV
ncbi:MAG: DUF370 domain-containing protein [Clostridia bacterium]|nr:DUF370 domain-containing protein [Clostridia bacterium]MDD4047750.1 DUF370 domain-containing protein [Clostridia bacterium]